MADDRRTIISEDKGSQVGGILGAFAVGALIGGAAALLYAPRSGKITRQMIAEKGRELKGKVNDVMDRTPAFIDGKRAEFAAGIDSGKEAIREELAKRLRV
jgi:gas vesicle protein